VARRIDEIKPVAEIIRAAASSLRAYGTGATDARERPDRTADVARDGSAVP
jgi:hypothetical protein